MKKFEDGTIFYEKQDLIDNYRIAYDKAKEAAVAAAQVSMVPLLEMEKMWLEKRAKIKANNEKS